MSEQLIKTMRQLRELIAGLPLSSEQQRTPIGPDAEHVLLLFAALSADQQRVVLSFGQVIIDNDVRR